MLLCPFARGQLKEPKIFSHVTIESKDAVVGKLLLERRCLVKEIGTARFC